MIRNSHGTEVAAKKAPLPMMVQVERVRGDDVVTLFEYFTTTRLNQDYRSFVDQIAEKLGLARRVASISSGSMPVLFSVCKRDFIILYASAI